MKKKILFTLPITLFLISFYPSLDDFEKLVAQTTSQALKTKLIDFQKGGIEKSVEINDSLFSIDSLLTVANSYLNTPHRMGGTSHQGIDCSGLVYSCFRHFGIEMPHSSHEQARFGKIISDKDSLQKGDLLFFYNSYNSNLLITHTGFYLGNDQFIHTSASAGVIITTLGSSNYWNSRYLFATRYFQEKK